VPDGGERAGARRVAVRRRAGRDQVDSWRLGGISIHLESETLCWPAADSARGIAELLRFRSTFLRDHCCAPDRWHTPSWTRIPARCAPAARPGEAGSCARPARYRVTLSHTAARRAPAVRPARQADVSHDAGWCQRWRHDGSARFVQGEGFEARFVRHPSPARAGLAQKCSVLHAHAAAGVAARLTLPPLCCARRSAAGLGAGARGALDSAEAASQWRWHIPPWRGADNRAAPRRRHAGAKPAGQGRGRD
jgi:hypothetical protein